MRDQEGKRVKSGREMKCWENANCIVSSTVDNEYKQHIIIVSCYGNLKIKIMVNTSGKHHENAS